jgi:signal transduction histidine kinase
MFGRRLSLALVCLALAALLQGALACWAIESASAQVTRGRVASDLVKGHWQLAASKQRLRSWTSQALLLPNANTTERDAHISDMRKTLDSLQALTQKALALDKDVARAQRDWRDRQDTLAILRHSVDELDVALRTVRPLPADADPAATWDAFKRTFDTSQGQDLREHVRQTIDREQAAEMRERNAADRALLQLAGGVLLATLAIALLAAALALYFAQALRRPLNNLNSGAQALQRGELHHRMDERGSDEFAAVAHTLNTMTVELQQHRERETQARHELERQVNARTAELQEALHALQAVDASRRQLFADISHELRTPTTAIRGEAEIALRGPTKTSDDYQDSLRRIVDIAAQLGQVIDDLLTMARSDAHALWVHTQALPVAAPVNEALLQVQALAQERQVSVVWENRASSDLTLWCDGTRLRQLLVLLLDNAIRYSNESAQVTLHTSTDGKAWHAHVVDQGIGIPADELPRVFERHFRGEQARRHRADGVGLGLSLALALTEAQGGTLDMASVPGQGTTVSLSLPLKPQENA